MALEDQLLNNFHRLAPEQRQNLVDFSLKLLQNPEQKQETKTESSSSIYGIFKKLGPSPSAQDIAQTRKEIWQNWPASDI
ncbi:MAG: hypothetical protein ACAI44_06380 [Candidatus Sericytochromatia bacterium]